MSGTAPASDGPGRVLDVWLEVPPDGRPHRVGTLRAPAGANYAISFAYGADYLESGHAVPLSVALPLRLESYPDPLARPFFDNLLPEGERRTSEALTRRIDPADVAGLLAVLGAECPGAVSVLPHGDPPVKAPGHVDDDYTPLPDGTLREIVANVAVGRPPGERIGFSVAGVQRKLVLARHPTTRRFLLPRPGAPSTHILKVEAASEGMRGVVANEALCLAVLRRLGLPTVNAERIRVGDVPVLVVTRYDRAMTSASMIFRRHQEDAAQLLGVPRELKYEHDAEIAAVPAARRGYAGLFGAFAAAMRVPADTRDILLRAAFANFLLDNRDAHLKNFSALHGGLVTASSPIGSPPGSWLELAPLYDVVCIGAFPDYAPTLAMRIGTADVADAVTRNDWNALIRSAFPGRRRVPAATIRQRVAQLHDMAAAMLPAIDAAVSEGVATRREAKPVRDVAGARIRHLNRTMDWDIPADTDAVIHRGGGWALS